MTDGGEALALFGGERRVLGRWVVARVTGMLAGGVSVWLERPDDGASLQVIVAARGARALVETPAGSVLYHKRAGITDQEAGETTRAFAGLLERGEVKLGALFPHVLFGPKTDEAVRLRVRALASGALGPRLLDAGAPGAPGAPHAPGETLHFDPPGLGAFLSPELAVDAVTGLGWSLRAIYLPAVNKRGAHDYGRYVLEFVDPDTAESVRLGLAAFADGEHFGRVGDLSVTLLGFTSDHDALPPRVTSLCSWVLALLELKGARELRVRVPADASEVRALSFPADRAQPGAPSPTTPATAPQEVPRALNLAIDTECGQRCAFCSVKAYVRPVDEGDAALDSLRVQLRRAREQGVREVRLNGIDPLSFSRVLDVLDEVRALGFEKLWVYSPCRLLADEGFRRAVLDRMPADYLITVPLYGVTADVHEAVTLTPGSFAEVTAALDGLLREAGASHVALSTVVVKQNVGELPALIARSRALGVELHPHLPYPMRQTARDPYGASALREREIVERTVDAVRAEHPHARAHSLRVLARAVPHPCLLWRAEAATRLPVYGARAVQGREYLVGTEYRSSAIAHDTQGDRAVENAFAVATVPCPHASRCALASVCPAEHYAVYASLYGLDEFAAVSVDEVYRALPVAAHDGPSGR